MPGNPRTCECGTCPKCRHREQQRIWRDKNLNERTCVCGRCPYCKERDRIRGIEIDAWLASRVQPPEKPRTKRQIAIEMRQTAAAQPTSRWAQLMGAGFHPRAHKLRIPHSDE